jgi:tRNA dimethylallyltransferase
MEPTSPDNSRGAAAKAPGILVVGGPTASGKSALALELAIEFEGVIINADSMQVYRDLPVLTAQPPADQQCQGPHRLYGFLESGARLSAGTWAELARREIAEALAGGRTPIVVGGTGLYLHALVNGLSPMPEVPQSVHEETRALLAEIGPGALHERLQALDPAIARRLHPNDTQRVARAWEVLAATGVPLSRWQEGRAEGSAPYRFFGLFRQPSRVALFAAIDRRVCAMVEDGALSEVANVVKSLPQPIWSKGAGRVLGFAEFALHLAGSISLAEAVAAVQKKTRRYAKRQITWERHQPGFSNKITLEGEYEKHSAKELANFRHKIRNFLLTE